MFISPENAKNEKEVWEYPPQSPDLIPSDLYLWGTLKNAVYSTKPRTLQDMGHEIEIAWATLPPATIQKICRSLERFCQQCIGAGCGQFEHLCFIVTNTTMG
jgi:hypothetical protein